MSKQKSSIVNRQSKKTQWKIPWLDFYIVRGKEIRRNDIKIRILEARFKEQLKRLDIESRMTEKLLHQISVMQGHLHAPECPKCGKPKTAGGIQWLDHAECFAQGKSKKKKGKI